MWKNTDKFRQEAIFFEKHGYYNSGVYGTQEYYEYWKEQERRRKEGYSVDGQYITGDHYHYLNFTQIKTTTESNKNKNKLSKKIDKKASFPEFWDGDAEYFQAIQDCENEGLHLIVAKSRRKGYSYKNSALTVNRCLLYKNYQVSLGSYIKDYLLDDGALYDFVVDNINFINEHTAWARQALKDSPTSGEYTWGYEEYENGIKIKKGYLSSITSYWMSKNPEVMRGKSRELIIFEEAGAWPNLLQSIKPVIDTLKDGNMVTGLLIVFGTGGGKSANWEGFEEIFYNPSAYGFKVFENKWEPESPFKECGFFHPYQLNLKDESGCYMDEDGNSFYEKAKEDELNKREKYIGNSTLMHMKKTENPLTPSEAFLKTSFNDFPIAELTAHLAYLQADSRADKLAYIGELYETNDGEIKWRPNKELKPIVKYPLNKSEDKVGCTVIWELPYRNNEGIVPEGMYEAGLDPYSQDEADSSVSLATCWVRKKNTGFNGEGDILVAEYTGRPSTADEYYNNMFLLLDFFGAKVMAENMFRDFFQYARQKGKEYLLEETPNDVINAHIKKTQVKRGYGSHMTKELKLGGIRYIKNWLLTERGYDEKGNKIYNLHTIKSIPLLQELIKFDFNNGNFDRISALIQLMFFKEQTFQNEIRETFKKSSFFSKNLFKPKNRSTTQKFR